MQIMQSESISQADLATAEIDMKMFNILMSMYGDNACRANVHNAKHYKKCTEVNGPLWSNSGFNYENFNRDFKKLFNGTQHVEKQILNALLFIWSNSFLKWPKIYQQHPLSKLSINIWLEFMRK